MTKIDQVMGTRQSKDRRMQLTKSDLDNDVVWRRDQLIGRLLLELDSGGNIKLEDGRTNEPWFSSCMDLIATRFYVKVCTVHVCRVINAGV